MGRAKAEKTVKPPDIDAGSASQIGIDPLRMTIDKTLDGSIVATAHNLDYGIEVTESTKAQSWGYISPRDSSCKWRLID